MTTPLTVGSLCTGIGGIDLGLERAGMNVIWQSEIEPYCNTILAQHWPNIPNLGDMKQIDWTDVERPDLLCGGYPCQPFSLAGRRRGDADERHLWPYVATAIGVLQPSYVFLENVYGHLSKGFGEVLADLATLGYDAEWDCLPASTFGAPHIRDRVIIVAYPHADLDGREGRPEHHRGSIESIIGPPFGHDTDRLRDDVADPHSPQLPYLQGSQTVAQLAGGRAACGAGWWDIEPNVGRVADGVPKRVDRIHALGNSVVPQVAEYVGRNIIDAHIAGLAREAA